MWRRPLVCVLHTTTIYVYIPHSTRARVRVDRARIKRAAPAHVLSKAGRQKSPEYFSSQAFLSLSLSLSFFMRRRPTSRRELCTGYYRNLERRSWREEMRGEVVGRKGRDCCIVQGE